MPDIYQLYGFDVQRNAQGDLLPVVGVEETEQRIIRRLLTNPGDLLDHPDYGAGFGRYIGQVLSEDVFQDVKNVGVRQILQEASVTKNPIPVVTVLIINNTDQQPYLRVSIQCYHAKTKEKMYLTFDVKE